MTYLLSVGGKSSGHGKSLARPGQPARVPEATAGNRDFRHIREDRKGAILVKRTTHEREQERDGCRPLEILPGLDSATASLEVEELLAPTSAALAALCGSAAAAAGRNPLLAARRRPRPLGSRGRPHPAWRPVASPQVGVARRVPGVRSRLLAKHQRGWSPPPGPRPGHFAERYRSVDALHQWQSRH